jgi:TfoX/Sxy family transcriptional regulator of competence genes
MASDQAFVKFAAGQMEKAGEITYRAMFGEYAIYCDGKLVALVCDNRLLIKPTDAGRAFIGDVVEAEPYPGAKPALLIEDRIDDSDWLSELVRLSWPHLPEPKPRKPKRAKQGK